MGAHVATLRKSISKGSLGELGQRHHRPEITTLGTTSMTLALFLFFWFVPPATLTVFTPVQKYVALESQKLMLFEYGQPFKLHKRSRAELYRASVGR
jgi:hypothetical protein